MFRITPISAAALGAGVGYYTTAGRNPPAMLCLLVPVCLLGAAGGLACFFPAPGIRRRVRLAYRYGIALVAGWCFGLSAGAERPIRLGLPDQEVIGLQGTLRDDPRNRSYGGGIGTLRLTAAAGAGGVRTSAAGTIPVIFPEGSIPELKAFGRGCVIYIEGSMEKATRRFRARSAHIIRPASRLEQIRTAARGYILRRFTGPEWGGLASALLLGDRDTLDTSLAQSYRDAGCAHVLALSGMHLAIVAAVIAFLLKKPLGLRAAAGIGAGCILGYGYLVGNLPSLQRAAIMYVLGVLAVLGSLPKPPLTLLAMTFLIQLGLEPESGRSLSFILSYVALGGIISVGECIYDRIRGLAPEGVSRPASASIGAFIATAPIGAAYFGVLRPIGIIAGIIIVPPTALFMLCALLLLGADWGAPFLVPFLEGFLSLVYAVLERLISLCAGVPGITGPPLTVLVGSLCAAAGSIYWYTRQQRERRRLDPFA